VAPNQQACIHFSMKRGMRIMNYVQVFTSAVKRVEFVSDRMSYVILKRTLVTCHCSERSCPNRR
jgi:hypothetical protein